MPDKKLISGGKKKESCRIPKTCTNL